MKDIKELFLKVIKARKKLIQIYGFIFLLGMLMIIIRKYLNFQTGFSFLFKNYILAMVPLIISSFLVEMTKMKFRKWTLILVGSIWLIFLPNAPYMLTDYKYISMDMYTYVFIFHLSLFILPTFLAGLISLYDIKKILMEKWSIKKVNLLMIGICLLTGIGIGIGSVLRFNSWDIFHSPITFTSAIFGFFIHPLNHTYAWMVSICFGFLFYTMFTAISIISNEFRRQE